MAASKSCSVSRNLPESVQVIDFLSGLQQVRLLAYKQLKNFQYLRSTFRRRYHHRWRKVRQHLRHSAGNRSNLVNVETNKTRNINERERELEVEGEWKKKLLLILIMDAAVFKEATKLYLDDKRKQRVIFGCWECKTSHLSRKLSGIFS